GFFWVLWYGSGLFALRQRHRSQLRGRAVGLDLWQRLRDQDRLLRLLGSEHGHLLLRHEQHGILLLLGKQHGVLLHGVLLWHEARAAKSGLARAALLAAVALGRSLARQIQERQRQDGGGRNDFAVPVRQHGVVLSGIWRANSVPDDGQL